ncbi:MAG: SLBB domain-containing protein [Nitrospirae bacterium]|nr:SLBB domain-containing protein [Nitrospirota bacterium]
MIPVSPNALTSAAPSPLLQQSTQQPVILQLPAPETTQASPLQQAPGLTQQLPEKPSEIENFISGSTSSVISTNIKQFGYDLFRQSSSAFAPAANVPVGPDYVIGPGDEIKISVWGKIEGQWKVGVDRDGNISLPKIGTLGVTGLTFKELKDVLLKEFSKYYTGFEMNVSMGSLRTIRIYVVGNAENPGTYTVSSLSTLVNALFQVRGPNKTGTMRDIQVKRNGKTVVNFDMYDFLLKGDKTRDIRLMPEDVIFIPTVGPIVGIAGNVRNPAIYEIKGETRLLELIGMAGGLTSIAFKGRVQVQRIENNQFRNLFEGDLIDLEKNTDKNFSLQDGDLVRVFSVAETKNTITVTGAVAYPGDYGIVKGVTKIKDIISLAGGILYFASSDAELTRTTVSPLGPKTERFSLDIFKAMDGDPQHNLPLEINDYLFIRAVPEWRLYQTVAISGEIKFPGTYIIKKGERLASLIERAGGYTDKAYLRGAVFIRNSVRELQQKSLDEMIARLERELLAGGSIQVSTAVSAEEVESKKLEMQQKQEFIQSLRNLKATGRMTIRLAHLRLLKGSEYDIELEEGDNLYVPIRSSAVNVTGAVMSRGSFVYSERFDYKDYIEMAGGMAKYADTDNIYVLKVDGSAKKLSKGFFDWNASKSRWEVSALGEEPRDIEPGDSIVVPEKLERIAWLRETKDLTQIIYQIAVSAGVMIALF